MNLLHAIDDLFDKVINALTSTSPPQSASFDLTDVTLVLIFSAILSLIIAKTYQSTYRGLSYSQSFVQTIVILGTVVSVVILVVGSSIARAFALFGALSIVRFRNAVKETRDLAFVFFVMTIGMAIGTRYYSLGILATALISLLIHGMTYAGFGRKSMTEFLLEVELPSSVNYVEVTPPVLRKHLKSYSLITMEGISSEKNLLTFVIDFKTARFPTLRALLAQIGLVKLVETKSVDERTADLVSELLVINKGLRAAVLQGDKGIEL